MDMETHREPTPGHIVKKIRRKIERQILPAGQELRQLLELCNHPQEKMREEAIIALLHPPDVDEFAHYRWLLPGILTAVACVERLPVAILELVFDLVGFLGEIPRAGPLQTATERVLSHLSKSSFAVLLQRPLAPGPFLPWIKPRTVMPRRASQQKNFKRRWRILRRNMPAGSVSPAIGEITWTDLKPLLQSRQGASDCGSTGRWRRIGRALLLPSGFSQVDASSTARAGTLHKRGERPPLPPLAEGIYYGGLGSHSLRCLDLLIRLQAKELAAVKGLATAVSQKTRRVVLSLHNASLAAAGGWAFEKLSRQFPSEDLWLQFKRGVQRRMESASGGRYSSDSTAIQLFDLWEERLVRPKALHAMWESRLRAALDEAQQDSYERDLESSRVLLKSPDEAKLRQDKMLGWCGAVSPHQRIHLGRLMDWCAMRKRIWQKGLVRLTAMLAEGQELMTKQKLPYLVLPWIDKFFISSRRVDDIEYLPSLFSYLEQQGADPLVLFWEDTSHGHAPSLQLMLKRLATQGLPFRGIGVFDPSESKRDDALQHILNEHRQTRLFALRPLNDLHHPWSLEQLLQERNYPFFRPYDSAWKDGLAFIYVGTQVFPLLSIQCDVEQFPPWLAWSGRKYPFGLYFRERLRELSLDERDEAADPLCSAYDHWANLL